MANVLKVVAEWLECLNSSGALQMPNEPELDRRNLIAEFPVFVSNGGACRHEYSVWCSHNLDRGEVWCRVRGAAIGSVQPLLQQWRFQKHFTLRVLVNLVTNSDR